jgi:phosphatidylserine decarboxylase
MKYSGKALRAGLKLISLASAIFLALGAIAFLAPVFKPIFPWVGGTLLALWLVFTLFTLYFFRDPIANSPKEAGLVLCPGHGTVDLIDELKECEFMNGPCHRISMFLSVINVHVQNAPISGQIGLVKHTSGQFLNAMRTDCAEHNENVLIGIESSETPGERVGVRLITGAIARRIVPFVSEKEIIERGQRISLIQFGSRADLYIPLNYKIQVKMGDKVVGGETVMARKS